MGFEARQRRRRLSPKRSHRPPRAPPETRPRDHRSRQRSLLHAQPPWKVWPVFSLCSNFTAFHLIVDYSWWVFVAMSVSFAWRCTTTRATTWPIHRGSAIRLTWQSELLVRPRRLLLNPSLTSAKSTCERQVCISYLFHTNFVEQLVGISRCLVGFFFMCKILEKLNLIWGLKILTLIRKYNYMGGAFE